MDTVYKNIADMTKEELAAIVELIVELDKLSEGEQPEKQLELVTAIQTLIRVEEEVVLTNTEIPVEENNDTEGRAPEVAEAA